MNEAGNLLFQNAGTSNVDESIDFMRRYGRETRAEFTGLGDRPTLLDTLGYHGLLSMITRTASSMKYTSYTNLSRRWYKHVIERLLPSTAGGDPGKERRFDYDRLRRSAGRFAAAVCRNGNIPRYPGINCQRAISRMVAMRSAQITRPN